MVAQPPSASAFARKVVNPLGFTKVYNFWLYIIFGGALTGFVLARLPYLNFSHNFCPADGTSESGNSTAPGECYYYLNSTQYKVGILLHPGGVLPASLIAVAQFTPFIRHRWILIHRIGGYAALLLFLVSLAGAFMIMRHAFGGGLDVQVALGVLGLSTLASFTISYVNVKRLQIEQHRAWMLRGWFYAGAIVTLRIILIISAQITAKKGYYVVWTCARIAATVAPDVELATAYPACAAYADGSEPDAVSAVAATFGAGDAANTGAAFNAGFGMALWLALVLHAVGVEVYLHLTPREAQRLRQVSYQKQLEAGMRNPGSAGLTADRLGDAYRWVPEVREDQLSASSAEVVTVVSDEMLASK
ncbi:hypothetical protein COCMIDRAFT_109566 [Bipolaris oryzae ATCC 44560]|uniref:DUF2306 domain-containing protein n=1 Tax=Bipolaris oryzae ATCC 44560 TaxID=930090 RepID=W6Z8W5_COCMI|nr:uncharacterized protein COCMIDRAFT_109566 [Bipolaris oryzae ATCC 44560]EUC40136.1 hypothetical protein COCMIDRAFT_109566 [Bipolaris oryzae ATCC 44560]